MIGRQLGRFRILDELGSGGMGTVYRAHDPVLERTVAVKVLPTGDLDPDRRRRFLAEARAASSLSHPAVVTVFELGCDGDVDFIAMELVEGRSLQAVLAEGPLVEDRARRFALVLAQTLAFAHRAGVVHRDLKPGNVMVTPEDTLKILDFGLAKRLPSAEVDDADEDEATVTPPPQTAAGVVLGTPAYMSPEQARGEEVDHRSDLFSLGCVLYEMLTGERPFRGAGTVETLSAILRDQPPPPSSRRPGVSPSWDGPVGRLLAKKPDERYSSADELVVDLRQLDVSPSAAGDRRRWALAALLVAASLAAVLAAWLWPRSGEREPSAVATEAAFPEYRFRLAAELPGSPREPSLSPDGRMVAFVMEDGDGVDQVWVMDLGGGQPLQITSGGESAGAPAWSPQGERIVFHRAGDGIWEVPPLGGDAHRLLAEGTHPAVSRDGARLAYNRGRRLWVADGDGGDPRPLPALEPLHFGYLARPDLSPDGRRVVTFWPHPARPLGDLWIAPVEGGKPRQLTDLGFLSWGTAPVWSDDGRWVVFTSDHGGSVNLWRVPAAGGEPRPVTSGAGSDWSPDVSADMARLVYVNGRTTAAIHVHDPAADETRIAYRRRNQAITPRLSPEGGRVAFFARGDDGFQLFVADLETGDERQVTHLRGTINTHPVWSADGRMLYYYQQPHPGEPSFTFRRIMVDGRGDEKLLEDWRWPVQHQTSPSPDGMRVVYLLRQAGRNLETRVRDLATGDEHRLPLPLYDPRWTADGTRVYGADWESGRVHVCRTDGSVCRDLAAGWWGRLSPDGATLHVLRGEPPQVWRHDLKSGSEQLLMTVDPYHVLDFGWGVTPTGEVVYHTQHRGKLELWLGEARDAGR